MHENHSLQTLVHELRLVCKISLRILCFSPEKCMIFVGEFVMHLSLQTIEKYQQDLVERRGTAELLKENAILKSESRVIS